MNLTSSDLAHLLKSSAARQLPGNLAWRTTAMDVTSIVAASTRGRAISVVVKCANECGYGVKWPDVKARRAPEYDAWAATANTDQCYSEKFVTGGAK